jgi:methyl-accepting chemotaxis protein
MGPRDAILAPVRAAGALARAADDLHTLAERARRDPDPVDEARERLDGLSSQLEALISLARGLQDTSQEIVTGGRDLRRSAEGLDDRTRRIIDGGQDLTAVGEEIASSLRVVLAALPQVLDGLSSVEELEESVGTVAETVEPLQGLTNGVGRMSQRLSRTPGG